MDKEHPSNQYLQRYERYSNHIAYLEALRNEWRMKYRLDEPIIVEYHILRRLVNEAILRARYLQSNLSEHIK